MPWWLYETVVFLGTIIKSFSIILNCTEQFFSWSEVLATFSPYPLWAPAREHLNSKCYNAIW